jgi:hypothetical protein
MVIISKTATGPSNNGWLYLSKSINYITPNTVSVLDSRLGSHSNAFVYAITKMLSEMSMDIRANVTNLLISLYSNR